VRKRNHQTVSSLYFFSRSHKSMNFSQISQMATGGSGVDLSELSPLQNTCLGVFTGIMSKMCNYPLLSVKNRVQQGLTIPWKTPLKLYRGLPMGCINLGGTTGVQFFATGFFQRAMKRIMGIKEGCTDKALLQKAEVGGAALGGLFSGIPCSLWELTMIQQQRFGGTLLGTPVRIANQYGAITLGRGIVTCCGRETMFTMAMLGIVPVLQRELRDTYSLSDEIALAGGALIGSFFAGTVSHPMDTIKTCMQGDVGQQKYKSITATARLLAAEYGVREGLFKGLSWRVALIGTTFFLVNKFKQIVAPTLFTDEL